MRYCYGNRVVIAGIPYKKGVQDGIGKSQFKNGKSIGYSISSKNRKTEGVGNKYYKTVNYKAIFHIKQQKRLSNKK